MVHFNKAVFFVTILILAFIMTACRGGEVESSSYDDSLKNIPSSVWEKLENKKIYFGHQSVGNNIIDGMKDIIKQYPKINLNILETTDKANFSAGVFAHSRIGENANPALKVNDFIRVIDEEIGNKTDIAFFKFCYVDFTEKTDVKSVFENYNTQMTALIKRHPETTFIHFTIPLTAIKTTWKTQLKKIIGKDYIWEYADNIKRNHFNELLKQEYQDKQPIFDIADIEATRPDGAKESFTYKGHTYLYLVPEYTNDGGHLNEKGRKIVAEKLLRFLLNVE